MTSIARSLLTAALLLATVACGSTGPSAAHSVGMVTLEVSGGFTGWDRILVVDADGTAHMKFVSGPTPEVEPRRVDAGTLAHLHSLVSDPAFASLAHAYLPPPGGADLQDYTVTAEVDGRQLPTMTRDGASPPDNLREVLRILNGILTSFQGT